MVRTVQILAIPTRWEMMDRHDASRARFLGEVWGLGSSREDGLEAGISKTWLGAVDAVYGGVSDSHAETLVYVSVALRITGCL